MRLPFHKVLVFQSIELSESSLRWGGTVPTWGWGCSQASLSQGCLGFGTAPDLSPETLPLSPGKPPRPLLRQGVVIWVILWCVKYGFPAKHKAGLPFKTQLSQEDQDSSHAAHGTMSSLKNSLPRQWDLCPSIWSHQDPKSRLMRFIFCYL